MKIAILGSTGFIGKRLVSRALQEGHSVNALARSPEKLGDLRSSVVLFRGDLGDADVLSRLVAGTDAVLSAAGPSNRPDQPELFERAMKNLVAGMENANVNRLVMISGGATLIVPGERVNLRRRLLNLAMRLTSGNRVAAKEREFHVIAQSSLRWTSVRPPLVKEDAASGEVLASEEKLPGLRISVDVLVQFMLEQLRDDAWVRKAPLVASRPAG